MKMRILFLLFLCITVGSLEEIKSIKPKRAVLSVSNVAKSFTTFRTLFKEVFDIWTYVLREPNAGVKGALTRSKEHEIIGRLVTINKRISMLDVKVGSFAAAVTNDILRAIPSILQLELSLHELSKIKSQINTASNDLQRYLMHGYKNSTNEEIEITLTDDKDEMPNKINTYTLLEADDNKVMKRDVDNGWRVENFTLQEFANWASSHASNSPMTLLRRLHDLVVGDETDDNSLFQRFIRTTKEMRTNICNLRQSPHQVLYNLYNTIALAELKGNTVLQFSYMLLKMYNKGNFTVEAELAKKEYEKNAKEKIEIARKALADADRSIYKCDPKQHVEGNTYTKLTKLLQGYIENEVNLNPYGTCRENCAYYQFTEYNGCFKNKFCAHQPQCRGRVVECRYVDSDMNICSSSNPERRYDWIEYENGKVLGTKGVCERKNLHQVDSWWRYLFWHCSYCLCLCDDSGHHSDRYFNLRDVTSDVEDNKIVTGVRILKHNQIIHLQIQQGVLTPRAVVDKTTLSWKPVDNYTIDDDFVENRKDYFTMNWMERSIDMDEVFGPPEHVVTGVRFRKLGSHLNLEILVTPINFTTGNVLKGYSFWIGNDNTDASLSNPRQEILLTNPDIPIRNGPHALNSKHDQYIQFQATNFETDAGQSTVPFFDSQILTSQGFPISGVGLIHRGKAGSGGFIAPKLISYDFLPHLQFEQIK